MSIYSCFKKAGCPSKIPNLKTLRAQGGIGILLPKAYKTCEYAKNGLSRHICSVFSPKPGILLTVIYSVTAMKLDCCESKCGQTFSYFEINYKSVI